jgi:hypothetical protein
MADSTDLGVNSASMPPVPVRGIPTGKCGIIR